MEEKKKHKKPKSRDLSVRIPLVHFFVLIWAFCPVCTRFNLSIFPFADCPPRTHRLLELRPSSLSLGSRRQLVLPVFKWVLISEGISFGGLVQLSEVLAEGVAAGIRVVIIVKRARRASAEGGAAKGRRCRPREPGKSALGIGDGRCGFWYDCRSHRGVDGVSPGVGRLRRRKSQPERTGNGSDIAHSRAHLCL